MFNNTKNFLKSTVLGVEYTKTYKISFYSHVIYDLEGETNKIIYKRFEWHDKNNTLVFTLHTFISFYSH